MSQPPVSSCSVDPTVLTRPLCSSSITEPSSLLRVGPPQILASVLSPCSFGRFSFSLGIQGLVPAVPRESLHPIHAPCTPAAVYPVVRRPIDSSQGEMVTLVLATSRVFDASSRVYLRSSLGCPPARILFGLLIQRSPPHLLNAAAWTGLGPSPESRSRWTYHHLSRSLVTRLGLHTVSPSVCLCSTR